MGRQLLPVYYPTRVGLLNFPLENQLGGRQPANRRRSLRRRTARVIDSAMGTKEIKCFTQNQSGLGHKPIPPPHFAYANCSATRQRFLIHRFVQFASRNAQGPAVCPSGQTRHDGQNIGEMSFPCLPSVFPTTSRKPHLSTVLTAPSLRTSGLLSM